MYLNHLDGAGNILSRLKPSYGFTGDSGDSGFVNVPHFCREAVWGEKRFLPINFQFKGVSGIMDCWQYFCNINASCAPGDSELVTWTYFVTIRRPGYNLSV